MSKYALYSFFFLIIFFLFGCATQSGSVVRLSNIQQLNSFLTNNVSVETYDVSFFHHYGKHVASINNLSLKIKDEKIVYLNGSFYEGGGTGKYYADTCYIIYDSINSIKNINCKVLDGYDASVNVSDVELQRNNFYSSVLNELDANNYSLISQIYSFKLVTVSDKKKEILKILNEDIIYHNLTDEKVILSGECFYWNITYGGISEHTVCFNDDSIISYVSKGGSFGFTDNQEWSISID